MKKNIYAALAIALASGFCTGISAQNLPARSAKVEAETEKRYEGLLTTYKYLHQNPELSFKEEKTSAFLAAELRKIGFEVTEKFGGWGVVAVMKNGAGPTVMLRADTDGLPIEEKTGLPYASTVKSTEQDGSAVSVMHGCGHDIHMSSLIGAGQVLAELKKEWKGTLILVGQPAEERSGGAKAMLAEGLFSKFPKPDYAVALHTDANSPAGTVSICPGPVLASVDMVDITVYGRGGHGAYPHKTIDPIVMAARIVMDLQTLVSREISPMEPAVVTVGAIHGGAKHNIIPDEVKMQLTLRSYKDEVRMQSIEGIKRITKGIAMSAGMPEDKYPLVFLSGEATPPTINDEALALKLEGVFKGALGEANVLKATPVMGGEDFGQFGRTAEKVPTVIYWLGVVQKNIHKESIEKGLPLPSLHSSLYAPDPISIKTGVKTFAEAALSLFAK